VKNVWLMRTFVWFVSFIFVTPAHAAFCMAPRAPSVLFISKPAKPIKPYCVSLRSCEQWQITSYNNDVERYNSEISKFFQDLETYANDVDRYRKRAAEYIDCMSSD
jgi:hypothetical protein